MAASLLIDVESWDLCLDAKGNWALATDPYAIEQNVATACSVLLGECVYDTTKGIPLYEVLNGNYPVPLLQADIEDAAKGVAGVNGATLTITSLTDRKLSGQIALDTDFGTLYTSL